MGCPRVRELWALLCGLEMESSSIARMGADRGPWDPRGSEGKGLICCIVHRHPSSCSGPDPVPAPYHPQSLSCTNPSLSSIPVSYQFCSQSQSQSQFQRQSQLSPSPISVLVSGPAQTNSSSTVSPIPSPVQPSTRGGAGTHIRAILVEFPTGKQQRRWTERTAAAPWTARPRKGRRCVRSGAMAPWVLGCWDEGWELGAPLGAGIEPLRFQGDPAGRSCADVCPNPAGLRVAHPAPGVPQGCTEGSSPQQCLPAAAALSATVPPRLPDRPPDPAA